MQPETQASLSWEGTVPEWSTRCTCECNARKHGQPQSQSSRAGASLQGIAVYRPAFLSVSSSSPSHPSIHQPNQLYSNRFTSSSSSILTQLLLQVTPTLTLNRHHALLIRHLRCRCRRCSPGSAHLPDQRWSDPGSSCHRHPRRYPRRHDHRCCYPNCRPSQHPVSHQCGRSPCL
jgi:hypothetical protein